MVGKTGIYEIIPGFAAGMLVAVVVSLCGKRPSLDVMMLFEKSRKPQD